MAAATTETAATSLTHMTIPATISSDPLFVTLNSQGQIRDELIHDETVFRHPVFDQAAVTAQDTVRAINGQNRTWFCGAWMRHGFHEDGLSSALDVVHALNAVDNLSLAAE